MNTSSPLRYPGGKASMCDLLSQVREINGLGCLDLSEPFAGGAGAALSLLYREQVRRIFINDKDESIFSFWWTVLRRPAPLLDLIQRTPVEIDEWRRQRAIYRSGRGSRLRRGFAAFYLNRCNRSGIIGSGGPIGGVEQTGQWKVDARFNKSNLIKRCLRVGEYRDRITASDWDGIEFIRASDHDRVMHFVDPPYYEKGSSLYLNSLDHEYHARLASELRQRQDSAWILTYDDCDEVRCLYEGWANVRPFDLHYAATHRRLGKEILIAPSWMRLPGDQQSASIRW